MQNIIAKLGRDRQKSVHFIGIGGIGLSAIARWFRSEGWKVSGSDLVVGAITENLKKEGIKIFYGDKAAHVKRVDLVIVSQAIPKTSAEYRAARKAKVPVLARPEILGEVSRRYSTIAVAGAHGKSTTTAMLSLLLIAAKHDPTVIVGTKLREFPQFNFRKGKTSWLVLEADEYGRAFLHYSPLYALVTNIDREHLDIYGNLSAIKKAFLEFMGNVRPGGALVLNADDKNLAGLRAKIEAAAKKREVKVLWYSLRHSRRRAIEKALTIPGLHNVSNAIGAYVLATKVLHIPEKTTLASLAKFTGTWRRAEHRGDYTLHATRYTLFDDYAHHPTEIATTLEGFKKKYPSSPLICVFQPHQADRLKRLFKEFTSAFKAADVVLFFPEYRVAGRDEKVSPFNSRALAFAVQKKYPKQAVHYVENPDDLTPSFIAEALPRRASSAIVIMMGAGNIVDYTQKLTG